MDAKSAMYSELIKEALLKSSQTGGITMDELRAKLSDIPEERILSTVEEMKFGGMIEESDEGKLIMISFF